MCEWHEVHREILICKCKQKKKDKNKNKIRKELKTSWKEMTPEKQSKTLWQCSPVDWEGNEGITGLVMAKVYSLQMLRKSD